MHLFLWKKLAHPMLSRIFLEEGCLVFQNGHLRLVENFKRRLCSLARPASFLLLLMDTAVQGILPVHHLPNT
jgi:hypothetical protein